MRFETSRGRSDSGFSLLEVMVALALLATGVLFAFTMITGASLNNELNKDQALSYRACQDVMEALMTMDSTTLLAQKSWQTTNGDSTFEVTNLGVTPAPTGTYSITDISTSVDATASADSVLEIQVKFEYERIKVLLTARRYLP